MKVNVDSLEDAMATTLSCRLEGLLLPQAYTNYLRAKEEGASASARPPAFSGPLWAWLWYLPVPHRARGRQESPPGSSKAGFEALN